MPSDILILLRKTAVGACVPKPDHRRFKVAAKGAYAKATAGLVCDVQFLCHLTNQFRDGNGIPSFFASMSILAFSVSRCQRGPSIDNFMLLRSAEFSMPQVSFRHIQLSLIDVQWNSELNLRATRLIV